MNTSLKFLAGGHGRCLNNGVPLVAGVDEAGRGPLAGPVVASAVILDPRALISGINDSKKLSARRRESLAEEIKNTSLAWSVAWATPLEIDALNILHATLLAMRRALDLLPVTPQHALIDGNRCPDGLPCTSEPIVGGDALECCIGAASILAKVARDADMLEMHALYPLYGFDRHKGYPTKEHRLALERYGSTPEHRQSFAPVRAVQRCS